MKGPLGESIPEDLRAGLRLHRRVDSISNQLPEIRRTYHRFGPELRRMAPVLLDLVADHVFAKHWSAFSGSSLQSFTLRCYRVLELYELPADAEGFIKRMIATDLLASYADRAVVFRAMQDVLTRLGRVNLSVRLEELLENESGGFERDFFLYFPELERQVADWIEAVGLLEAVSSNVALRAVDL